MADLDVRAMTGLCCWRPIKGELWKHSVIGAKFTCSRPICATDELLCQPHAVFLRNLSKSPARRTASIQAWKTRRRKALS